MPLDKEKAGRVIFIGNIPYGLSEEQIIHTFSTVGQVLGFRLIHDKDTGQPKGFGFAEFSDADAAASAVRNLNDYEIMGRKLRVDFSRPDGQDDDAAPAGYTPQFPPIPNGASLSGPPPPPPQTAILPPLPPGVDLAPNLTCPDAISRTLSTLPPTQLLDILTQMKSLVMADPTKATELLKQAPQLSYAIFQALLLMGLVDTQALASVVEQPPAQQSTPQPVQAAQFPPPPPVPQFPGAQQFQPFPQSYSPFPPVSGPAQVATPPLQNQAFPPPPPALAAFPPEQKALIQQVLSMTPDQLQALPPLERAQIMQLRQQLMGVPS
ncbi:hypothetical protein L228DRAFT_281590 [Xylona heveae TC161]|uniref:RRM domain-containing protein n=1 Tax=Xylona heveae (strain CBS 132557 / TC161) TaxID=1328760 RepID=A0A161TQC2_XYLHT|nr:hypothetical protein L228DRAFT_281590 [Xylona heveae TC161]KZF24526.1 hypothetical protein L228DRAFT_281590 [Xylona heveae TC161]